MEAVIKRYVGRREPQGPESRRYQGPSLKWARLATDSLPVFFSCEEPDVEAVLLT